MQCVRDEVAMREHDALALTRRTTGIKQASEIRFASVSELLG